MLIKQHLSSSPRPTSILSIDNTLDLWSKPIGKGSDTSDWGVFADPIINVRMTSIGLNVGPEKAAELKTSGFLQSPKAVVVQAGGFGGFSRKIDEHLEWRFGPLGRYALQSVTDGEAKSRFWDRDDNLYDSYSFGGRIALYRRGKGSAAKDGPHSAQPVFYFDVSQGKFENFEIPVGLNQDGVECLAKFSTCSISGYTGKDPHTATVSDFGKPSRRNRTYFEMRLFISYLHFGFDLNNGPGVDDARFIFGMSINLPTLLSKMK